MNTLSKKSKSEPIFVFVRNDEGRLYDSYDDYWKLVLLSEFKTCELEEVDQASHNIYIFSPNNGNVKATCEIPHQATYILWQLERPGKIENIVPTYFNEMWVSDRYFHRLVNSEKCKFVPIGGHKNLRNPLPVITLAYNFVHLSYLYGERLEKVKKLTDAGYTMAPNGWGEDKRLSLSSSTWGLALHQDDMLIIEPLRYTLFGCWKLPIIAEYSEDFYPYKVTTLEKFNSGNFDNGRNIYDNYQLLTEEMTFRKVVGAALNENYPR